jgi:hypothetical protein
MYAKIFASLYQGTLRGNSHAILVFTNLLAHTGKDGIVDKHFRAIADETGLTTDEVRAAVILLESPDPESRSPEEGGARLIKLDEHRAWGWRVVNHGKYRAIRSEDDRAEQNRLAQARWRERNKSKPPVSDDKADKPMQRHHAESEASGNKQYPLTPKGEVKPLPKTRQVAPEFPDDLPEAYREPLRLWWQHKRETGKGYKPTGWAQLIASQRAYPADVVAASVAHSIASNYAGLFPPREAVTTNGRPARPNGDSTLEDWNRAAGAHQ